MGLEEMKWTRSLGVEFLNFRQEAGPFCSILIDPKMALLTYK
jgi:hypothetical protein